MDLTSRDSPETLDASQLGDDSMKLARAHLLINLGLTLITLVISIILNLLTRIVKPYYYELDMTEKRYCKTLAEIDNSLRFRRGTRGEYHPIANHGSRSNGTPVNDHDENNNNKSYNSEEQDSIGQRIGGSIDHVYPHGWIPVMESTKLMPGTVKKAIIFGRDVIVTRSPDGASVSVMEAYCPHMGVHIGIGGRVRMVDNESCVECPFHGWTFRASDGQCVKIPYQKAGSKCGIPKQAKLETWTSVEADNFIFVWHHNDGSPPTWFLNSSKELASPDWVLGGRSCHKVNLEMRDVLENGADMNHFEGIHNDLFIFGSEMSKLYLKNYIQKYARHHWQPEWKPVLDEKGQVTHMAEMSLRSWIGLFGIRTFDITIRARQLGPAKVNLYYKSDWYGTGLLTMHAIPIGGRKTKYIQHIYTKNNLFQLFMSKMVLFGEIKMLERDFFIWNHKKNIVNPIFVPEDKVLKQFRLWHSQFYSRKKRITIQNSSSRPEEAPSVPCKSILDF